MMQRMFAMVCLVWHVMFTVDVHVMVLRADDENFVRDLMSVQQFVFPEVPLLPPRSNLSFKFKSVLIRLLMRMKK